jgi:enoyl-CoA hydratase
VLRDSLATVASSLRDAGDPAAALKSAADVLDGLAKELRTPFEKESKLSSKVFQSEDAKEGPKAFAEKRPPRWQGK